MHDNCPYPQGAPTGSTTPRKDSRYVDYLSYLQAPIGAKRHGEGHGGSQHRRGPEGPRGGKSGRKVTQGQGQGKRGADSPYPQNSQSGIYNSLDGRNGHLQQH